MPDGRYEVALYMIEPVNDEERQWMINDIAKEANDDNQKSKKSADRVFDVMVNGQKLLSDINLREEAGPETAVIKKIHVDVQGGKGLMIDFKATKGQTVLSAIKVRRVIY